MINIIQYTEYHLCNIIQLVYKENGFMTLLIKRYGLDLERAAPSPFKGILNNKKTKVIFKNE